MKSSIQNWIADLQSAVSESYPDVVGAKVALGFYAVYLGIRSLSSWLKTISGVQSAVISGLQFLRSLHPNLPILFTGHSLGAAVASLAAIDYVTQSIHIFLFRFFETEFITASKLEHSTDNLIF